MKYKKVMVFKKVRKLRGLKNIRVFPEVVCKIEGLKQGFLGRFFVHSRAKKPQKFSLKLSTLEARSKYYSIFRGFYYLKHEKTKIFP